MYPPPPAAGLPYLDVIRLLRDNSPLPIAAYHVSGACRGLKRVELHSAAWVLYSLGQRGLCPSSAGRSSCCTCSPLFPCRTHAPARVRAVGGCLLGECDRGLPARAMLAEAVGMCGSLASRLCDRTRPAAPCSTPTSPTLHGPFSPRPLQTSSSLTTPPRRLSGWRPTSPAGGKLPSGMGISLSSLATT